MRHLSRIAAAVAAAGLAVTACGGSTNVLQGKSPQQVVSLASTSITSSSYHTTIHGTLSIDTSGIQGLPPQALDQFGSMLKGVTIDGSGDVQSAQRMRVTMTMKPLLSTPIVVVLYDGSGYVSQDNGKTFADAGSFNFSGLPVSPADVTSILKDVGPVQDQGSQSLNGDAVEKMHATLGPDFLSKVIGQSSDSAGGQAQQLIQLFAQAMSVRSGGIDLFVRHSDGKLAAEDTTATIAVDMGKLLSALSQAFGGQLPLGDASSVSGAMVMKITAHDTFSNFGAKFNITKPTVDPNAPGLPSGAGGLFGA